MDRPLLVEQHQVGGVRQALYVEGLGAQARIEADVALDLGVVGRGPQAVERRGQHVERVLHGRLEAVDLGPFGIGRPSVEERIAEELDRRRHLRDEVRHLLVEAGDAHVAGVTDEPVQPDVAVPGQVGLEVGIAAADGVRLRRTEVVGLGQAQIGQGRPREGARTRRPEHHVIGDVVAERGRRQEVVVAVVGRYRHRRTVGGVGGRRVTRPGRDRDQLT